MPPHKGQIYKSKPGTRVGHVYRSLSERFFEKVVKEESGCWRWRGAMVKKSGYGMLFQGGGVRRAVLAHRVSYELRFGAIPDGLVLDHLCRNRWCVNPDHLEAVTIKTNCLRGEAPGVRQNRQGVCQRGHVITPETSYKVPGYPHRWVCRSCQLEGRKAHAKSKEVA